MNLLRAHDRTAARVEPRMALAFAAALGELRKLDRPRLMAALSAKQPELAFHALPWDTFRRALDEGLYAATLFGLAAGGRAGDRQIPVRVLKAPPPGVRLGFDLVNPAAVRAAAEHAAWLVRGIDQRTRDGVAEIVRRGQLGQLDVEAQARQIEQLVGLDARQSNALLNYAWGLRREGRSEDDVTRLVQRQYLHRLRYRARMIARTESARAAVMGQNEAWRQAADRGWLDRQRTLREWLASPGACPICRELRGTRVMLDEPFGEEGATYDGPPAHPDCRCALRLVAVVRPAILKFAEVRELRRAA